MISKCDLPWNLNINEEQQYLITKLSNIWLWKTTLQFSVDIHLVAALCFQKKQKYSEKSQ